MSAPQPQHSPPPLMRAPETQRRSYTTQEKRLTMIALMVVLLLGALDQTIVSTALPRIIEQLHGLEMYAWVGTAYMLSSTVMVPIYGKLSDLYGRKPVLMFGIVVFLLGSMLCGLAGEFGPLPLLGAGMPQLIVFRALQGIGGGALFSSAFSVVAELFPPRERGKYMGLFGGSIAVASIAGPAIGGFFTDFANLELFGHAVAGWRWVFYINVPLGVAALALIGSKMPRLGRHAGGKVDAVGALLLITAFVPLLLALTWAGQKYAWSSPLILGLLALSVLALTAFIAFERRTVDAIVPMELFRVRAFSITNAAGFVIGTAFFGVVMFMPLFMQAVQGVNATNSGFLMLPLMGGMLLGAISSGQLVSRTGRYKLLIIGGGLMLASGVFFLGLINPHTSSFDLGWRMALVGLGLGPSQSVFTVVAQTAVDERHLGVATSSIQFFRQIGATIGIAIFGALLTHNLSTELSRHMQAPPGVSVGKMDLAEAQARAMNPQQLRAQLQRLLLAKQPLLERAYRGDSMAVRQALADPLLPEALKAQLRSSDSAGAVATPSQLAAVPSQLRAAAEQLSRRVEQTVKTAFSVAVTRALRVTLLAALLGLVLILCIPELPLGHRHPVREAAEA